MFLPALIQRVVDVCKLPCARALAKRNRQASTPPPSACASNAASPLPTAAPKYEKSAQLPSPGRYLKRPANRWPFQESGSMWRPVSRVASVGIDVSSRPSRCRSPDRVKHVYKRTSCPPPQDRRQRAELCGNGSDAGPPSCSKLTCTQSQPKLCTIPCGPLIAKL